MRVLAIAAITLALTACGSSGPTPLTAAQVKACSVRVYFSSTATRAQESAVATKLRADSRVVRVTFVSKAQALAKMKKEFPQLWTQHLPENPLPDMYIAVPDQLSDATPIAASMRHLPGVANVMHAGSLGILSVCSQG